tara:strand:- start:1958 stop:2116 length:159 start_codon:yes stop_codon:yes gene_type:complete
MSLTPKQEIALANYTEQIEMIEESEELIEQMEELYTILKNKKQRLEDIRDGQ